MIGLLVVLVLLALAFLCIVGRIPDGTYLARSLIALDVFLSALLWPRSRVCISSRCGLYLRDEAAGQGGPWFWLALGRALNRANSGHCEGSIAFDLKQLALDRQLLEDSST